MPYCAEQNNNNANMVFLKKLLSGLIYLHYKDLRSYIKNPQKTEKFLRKYNDSPEYTVKFWEKNAFVFLCFIVGSVKANKIMEKLNPEIKKAREILEKRKQLSNNFSQHEECEYVC